MCDCHSCSVCVTVWYPMVVCNLVCVLQDWTQWEALGPGLCVCVCVCQSCLYNSGSQKGTGGGLTNLYPGFPDCPVYFIRLKTGEGHVDLVNNTVEETLEEVCLCTMYNEKAYKT